MSMFVFHALNTLIVPILLCVSQQPSPLSFVVFPTSSGKGCSSPRDHAALQGASRISDAFFPHCLALLTISFSSARALILSPGHTHTPSARCFQACLPTTPSATNAAFRRVSEAAGSSAMPTLPLARGLPARLVWSGPASTAERPRCPLGTGRIPATKRPWVTQTKPLPSAWW